MIFSRLMSNEFWENYMSCIPSKESMFMSIITNCMPSMVYLLNNSGLTKRDSRCSVLLFMSPLSPFLIDHFTLLCTFQELLCLLRGLKRGVGRQNATTGKGSNHAETRVQQEGRTVEVEYRGGIQNRNGWPWPVLSLCYDVLETL